MKFEVQTIPILVLGNEWEEIQAMVNADSGLAYYEHEKDGFIVTTVRHGRSVARLCDLTTIFSAQAAYDESIVQRFIEQIAPLFDWSADMETLEVQARERFPLGVYHELRRIFHQVCETKASQQAS